MTTVRADITPLWPVRLPPGGMDGVLRRAGGVRERLLHAGGVPVVVRVAQHRDGRIAMAAEADTEVAAQAGLARMRFALGTDEDLRPFHERFRDDPLIGASVRRRPWLRPLRRPEPFEALAWAVTEQLIEYDRAAGIQRRIVRALGRRCERTGLRDVPDARTVAGTAPARLQSFDLSAGRSVALRRAAAEVASGRADLHAADHERGWARLREVPGIGRWTVEILALHGQARYDQLPAGDLAFLKLVGRLQGRRVAEEDEVRSFFERFGEWQGLAAHHALGSA